MNITENMTSQCDECGSKFLKTASKMKSLCPECAHRLYGYENCKHKFKGGRCIHCLWDGSSSGFLKAQKKDEAP